MTCRDCYLADVTDCRCSPPTTKKRARKSAGHDPNTVCTTGRCCRLKRPGVPLAQRESVIQAAILAYLQTRGDVYVWRNNTGSYSPRPGAFVRYGCPGSADILGVWAPSGRLLAIEVKRPGGRVSPEQRRWGARVVAHGGVYVVAYSVDDVRQALGPATVQVERKAVPR